MWRKRNSVSRIIRCSLFLRTIALSRRPKPQTATRKFLQHAKSSVIITAEHRTDSYEISISDDGAGIPPNAQPHIFERFYRAKDARLREEIVSTGSGAGLGLAISKFIAEAHDGKLALQNSDENGSTFTVRLPFIEIG